MTALLVLCRLETKKTSLGLVSYSTLAPGSGLNYHLVRLAITRQLRDELQDARPMLRSTREQQ